VHAPIAGIRWVALIRGINVGRAKRVAMADLRALLTGLGYSDVRTLLNSGNAVFTAGDATPAELGARISAALETGLGIAAGVIVLPAAELAEIAADDPLAGVADDPSKLIIAFLADPSDAGRLRELERRDWSPEAIAVGRRVAYLWCANGIADSALWKAVVRASGDAVTSRNRATVLKLAAYSE